MNETMSTIKKFILDEFLPGEDPEKLTATTPLITGGILDSLATLRLVSFISDTYGVEVEPHEMGVDHLDSLEDITKLVESKI
ncbi:MAG: acyl carrier protein [Anaerolineae bacterium]|nr:acyl carrier protein [Anaerolineae bacterium]